MEKLKVVFNPIDKIGSGVAVYIISLYKNFISPILPASCRYYPTCSAYSIDAIKKFGLLSGLYLSAKRILSCNPFSEGGYDPVPENFTFRK